MWPRCAIDIRIKSTPGQCESARRRVRVCELINFSGQLQSSGEVGGGEGGASLEALYCVLSAESASDDEGRLGRLQLAPFLQPTSRWRLGSHETYGCKLTKSE